MSPKKGAFNFPFNRIHSRLAAIDGVSTGGPFGVWKRGCYNWGPFFFFSKAFFFLCLCLKDSLVCMGWVFGPRCSKLAMHQFSQIFVGMFIQFLMGSNLVVILMETFGGHNTLNFVWYSKVWWVFKDFLIKTVDLTMAYLNALDDLNTVSIEDIPLKLIQLRKTFLMCCRHRK